MMSARAVKNPCISGGHVTGCCLQCLMYTTMIHHEAELKQLYSNSLYKLHDEQISAEVKVLQIMKV